MVLLLRHSDQIVRVRTSSTCEYDDEFTQEKILCPRGFELAHGSLSYLATSSLSLPSAGPKRSGAFDGSRSQAGLYRQAVCFLDPTSPPASSARRWHHQPEGGSGSAPLLNPAPRPWLKARVTAKFVVKSNMSMIVCRRKRCRRFITGWSPTSLRASHRPN